MMREVAGLSVAAQIMQRRQSISPEDEADAAETSSEDDGPEGSDELAELSRRNSVSGMSAKLRSKLEGIFTTKVADSSAPMPPSPLSPPAVATAPRPPPPRPHASIPTTTPSSADGNWRARPAPSLAGAATPHLAQPQQRPPKQKGARSRSRGGRGTAQEQAASGSDSLWRRAHKAGGIRLAPQRWCVLALVLIPAAAAAVALGAGVWWRWALATTWAASAAHGGPPGPGVSGSLVVPRGNHQRGQQLTAWGDKQRGGGDMDLTQQVLRASSEVFASALRDSTGRGDEAVAKRERTSAYLEQCEASLRARDDELAQSQRELRELRAELRESQDELVRVEAFIGGAKMEEAKRRRGWLRAFIK